MASNRFLRTSVVLLGATLAATSSAIDFSGQNDVTQTAGTVAPGGETPSTNAASGANGFGNFDSPTQWAASSSNNMPSTAPVVTSSGSGGWSQPTTTDSPAVYSAGSGQTWKQPTTTQPPSVWTQTIGPSSGTGNQGWSPPTSSGSGGQGWTQPTSSGSGNQATSGQGSGKGDQGWSQQAGSTSTASSSAGTPSTGESSGYADGTMSVDCSGSSEGGASPGFDTSLECSGSDEEEPAVSTSTAGSSNTTPTTTTAPTTSSENGDQGSSQPSSSSNTATSGSSEELTPTVSMESSGTGDLGAQAAKTSSTASSSNTESPSNTAQSSASSSNTASSSNAAQSTASSSNTASSATQGGSGVTQTDTSTGEHATFGKVTSKSGDCVIGDPDKYISTKDVNWIYEHRMGVNQTNNKNWIFDQIVKNKGSLNYCVRWDSTEKLSKKVASKFQAMLERQYAAWNRWLIGYGCWPYNKIKVNMVGFAVKEASLLDWTDDSLGTIYAGDVDAKGIPQCPQTCYNFFDNGLKTWSDTSGCKGKPFNLSLWPKQGLAGGFGYDWGQNVNLDNMLQTIDEEQLTIVSHEIGHGFGLPDFYEEADKPTIDMDPAIMMAGSSMTVTDSDGWMLRRGYEAIRDRYNFK